MSTNEPKAHKKGKYPRNKWVKKSITVNLGEREDSELVAILEIIRADNPRANSTDAVHEAIHDLYTKLRN